MDLKKYFHELKRRNVFKAALAYIVVGWVAIQACSILFSAFQVGSTALRTVILILIIGFPLWLVFAWVYEVTPDGLKRTAEVAPKESITASTNNKFDKLILGALGIAIVLLGFNLYHQIWDEQEMVRTSTPLQSEVNANSVVKENEEKSVAVLAFKDMSPQKDQEYLSDGISEEILNHLSKSPELIVMSRTSSFYFKDKNATVEEIGNKLEVEYLLEGSVRKAGNMIRITAQLVKVSTGAHIWSQNYDRELKDIFQIQDEIAEEVSNKLQASLNGGAIPETDPKMYTAFLRARQLYHQRTKESLTRGIAILTEAIKKDPDYAPAWALLSELYLVDSFVSPDLQFDNIEKGREAAEKAIKYDPDYGLGYFAMARYMLVKNEFKKSKKYAEKALALTPDNPEILRKLDIFTFPSLEVAIKNIKRSLRLNPLLYAANKDLALVYYNIGNYEDALKALEIVDLHIPGSSAVSWLRSQIYLAQGKPDLALEEIKNEEHDFWRLYGRIPALYHSGKKKQALEELEVFIKKYPGEATNIADVYAAIGNKEKTFEWLNKALEWEDPTLGGYVYQRNFRKYHDDPRWHQLLVKMGVPEDNGIPGYQG